MSNQTLTVMVWEEVHLAKIRDGKRYLVKTNGAEWRDTDLLVLPAVAVRLRLGSDYVRGRPIFVAEITDPEVALQPST